MSMTHSRSREHRIFPKAVKQSYEQWFNALPWQFFCTFTFPEPVADERSSELFWEFVNRVERRIRSNVVLVRFGEKSDVIRRHYHVLMTSPAVLDRQTVESEWRELVGPGKNTSTHPAGDSADVLEYDPAKGSQYCLKQACADEEPELHRFDLFRRHRPSGKLNHHKRRRYARATAQGSQL